MNWKYREGFTSKSIPDSSKEQTLRWVANKNGLKLRKSRHSETSGTYCLVDGRTDVVVAGGREYGDLKHGFGMSIDDVEQWLANYERSQFEDARQSLNAARVPPMSRLKP